MGLHVFCSSHKRATMRAVGRNASAVGMMEGAFFVGRTELLAWVNDLLQVNLTKVEHCASGAIYCQIIDACHPNSVAMRKGNWMGKVDHEYIPNYKILQTAFDKNQIDRHVDVDKLIRAKYQDNLEFLQFMKCYWDREGGSIPAKPGFAPERKPVSGSKPAAQQSAPLKLATTPRTRLRDAEQSLSKSTSSVPCAELAAAKEECKKISDESKDLRETLDGLEEERDYYFKKLRAVELFCEERLAEGSDNVNVKQITQLLYERTVEEDESALQVEGSD